MRSFRTTVTLTGFLSGLKQRFQGVRIKPALVDVPDLEEQHRAVDAEHRVVHSTTADLVGVQDLGDRAASTDLGDPHVIGESFANGKGATVYVTTRLDRHLR